MEQQQKTAQRRRTGAPSAKPPIVGEATKAGWGELQAVNWICMSLTAAQEALRST
nr:hypothetical protein [uncultured Roseateles sp.]